MPDFFQHAQTYHSKRASTYYLVPTLVLVLLSTYAEIDNKYGRRRSTYRLMANSADSFGKKSEFGTLPTTTISLLFPPPDQINRKTDRRWHRPMLHIFILCLKWKNSWYRLNMDTNAYAQGPCHIVVMNSHLILSISICSCPSTISGSWFSLCKDD